MATAAPSTSASSGEGTGGGVSGSGGGVSGSSAPVHEVAAEVPFLDLCWLMERVNKASGTERKKAILSTFLGQWREAHGKLHPSDAKTAVSGWCLCCKLV